MSPRLLVLVAITAAFGGLSVVALAEVGYIGIFEESLESWATTQVLFDLVIVAVLGAVWMLGDARERGSTRGLSSSSRCWPAHSACSSTSSLGGSGRR